MNSCLESSFGLLIDNSSSKLVAGSMISKEKISKANNVKQVHLVYQQISEDLANIDILRYVKIYNGSIKASNFLSENGKKEPVIKIGDENIVGVELNHPRQSRGLIIVSPSKGHTYESPKGDYSYCHKLSCS